MVHHSKKHKVAKHVEQNGDYAALVLGALGISALLGVIGAVTLLPDYNAGAGLFSMLGTFFTIEGTTITNAAALASGAGIFAYGTNQALDATLNVQESWKETEFAYFVGAAGFPLAHEFLTQVSDLFVGEPVMQVLGAGAYLYCMFRLTSL